MIQVSTEGPRQAELFHSLLCDCGLPAMRRQVECRRCWFLETGQPGYRPESQVTLFRELIVWMGDGPMTVPELEELTGKQYRAVQRSLERLCETGRAVVRCGADVAVYSLTSP